jgi:hypothetical protein
LFAVRAEISEVKRGRAWITQQRRLVALVNSARPSEGFSRGAACVRTANVHCYDYFEGGYGRCLTCVSQLIGRGQELSKNAPHPREYQSIKYQRQRKNKSKSAQNEEKDKDWRKTDSFSTRVCLRFYPSFLLIHTLWLEQAKRQEKCKFSDILRRKEPLPSEAGLTMFVSFVCRASFESIEGETAFKKAFRPGAVQSQLKVLVQDRASFDSAEGETAFKKVLKPDADLKDFVEDIKEAPTLPAAHLQESKRTRFIERRFSHKKHPPKPHKKHPPKPH